MAENGSTDWVGLGPRLIGCGVLLPTCLTLGEAGGVRPRGIRGAGGRVVGGAFRVGSGLGGSCGLGLADIGSAVLEGGGRLGMGSGLEVVVGLGASGLVVLVLADPAGFLAAAVVVGLVTSFLAGAFVLGGCAAVVLPAEGAVVPGLGAAGLVVEGAVVGLDAAVETAGRDAEGPVAGLVVLGTVVLSVLAAVEVPGLGADEAVGLGAVVLGFAPLTGALLLRAPFPVAVLAPLVAAVAEFGRAAPTGFLSDTLVWVLTAEAAAVAPPTGFLAAVVDDTPVVVVVVVFFLSGACFLARSLVEGLTPFMWRLEAVPGRELGPV